MERRNVLVALAVVVAAIAVAMISVALLGSRTPAATAPPIASASQSPTPASSSASASSTPSPSAAPTVTPTLEPTPSAAAGPPVLEWTRLVAGIEPPAEVGGVAFLGNRWFALGSVGPDPAIWVSDDGIDWSPTEVASTHGEFDLTRVNDVVELNGVLVAIGSWGRMNSDQFAWATWRSTDGGATWTEEEPYQPFALVAVTAGGPGLVATGGDYAGTTPFNSWIALTADGQNWERIDSPAFADSEIRALTTLGDRIIGVGTRATDAGYIPTAWISDDAGRTWRHVPTGSLEGSDYGAINDVTVLGDGLVAVGRVGTVADAPVAWISTDGETWRIELMGADGEATAVATMDGGVVAVGNLPGERNVGAEVAWTSADGILWAQSGPFGDGTLRLLGADGNGGLVIAGGICAADQCPAPLWRGDALE